VTIQVDFVEGVATSAPGVQRAQGPLASALGSLPQYDVREIRYTVSNPRLLFPFIYGPFPVALALRHVDLSHIANAWYAHVVPVLRRAIIVTCHDLIEIEEMESGERTYSAHRRLHMRAAFHGMVRARFIACVSHATADAILARSPSSRARLVVIHSGVSSVFEASGPRPSTIDGDEDACPYVLYVGSEQPRKNLDRLVAAIAMARRRVPGLRFVKVGDHQTPEGRAALLAALEREGMVADTVIMERVPDRELAALYRGAAVTVLPSLREGFGFPALEAMACGCPVVAANRPALREITDGAALLVDPLDVPSMAQALERGVCDAPLRRELIAHGVERAADFTWARAARQYADLYAEALRSP